MRGKSICDDFEFGKSSSIAFVEAGAFDVEFPEDFEVFKEVDY